MDDQIVKTTDSPKGKAFALNDLDSFKKLRNQVNRERKSCRKRLYRNKVEHLKSCSPATWWKEIKKLSGVSSPVPSQEDTMSVLHNIDKESLPSDHTTEQIANMINESFVTPMKAFNRLLPHLRLGNEDDNFPSLLPVTEVSAFKMLSTLNARKATVPDGIPAWVLKENADILASSVGDIINSSYKETHLPESWKKADIIPIPKQKPVRDVTKHLRPISLTAIVSKVAEEFVVENYVKPAVLKKIDSNQYGAIPNSSTTIALLSMLQSWNKATDGNGAAVRVL